MNDEHLEEIKLVFNELEKLKKANPEAYQKTIDIFNNKTDSSSKNDKEQNNLPDISIQQLSESIEKFRRDGLDSSENPLQDLMLSKEQKHPKSLTITPMPGFGYKTKQITNGLKVFINICQHDDIEKPSIKKKLNEDGEEVQGMNVPLSVGPGRPGKDKLGNECIIYDIIVNGSVITECQEDKIGKYRDFICQLGIQSLEQKYKIELDKRYKLPKLKYMGTIQSQNIKDTKSIPKIEEVLGKPQPNKKKAPSKKSESNGTAIQDQEIQVTAEWIVSNRKAYTEISEYLVIHSDISLSEFLLHRSLRDSHQFSPYPFPCNGEYIDPTHQLDDNHRAIRFSAILNIPTTRIQLEEIEIKISPFKLLIQIPNHKKCTVYLPCSCLPMESSFDVLQSDDLHPELRIVVLLDKQEWDTCPDVGSRSWLVAEALNGEVSNDHGDHNPYLSDRNTFDHSMKDIPEHTNLPEERFHVPMPDDVDPYTGLKLDGSNQQPGSQEDDDVLPEDGFHKKDAGSTYLIEQREQAIKEKWDKHNQEKASREADPNVEYIDVDDFKPGGKFGAKIPEVARSNVDQNERIKDEFRKAADVVLNSQQVRNHLKLVITIMVMFLCFGCSLIGDSRIKPHF